MLWRDRGRDFLHDMTSNGPERKQSHSEACSSVEDPNDRKHLNDSRHDEEKRHHPTEDGEPDQVAKDRDWMSWILEDVFLLHFSRIPSDVIPYRT